MKAEFVGGPLGGTSCVVPSGTSRWYVSVLNGPLIVITKVPLYPDVTSVEYRLKYYDDLTDSGLFAPPWKPPATRAAPGFEARSLAFKYRMPNLITFDHPSPKDYDCPG